MTMTPEALTLVGGGDATVPPGTSAAVFPSSQGKVSAVTPAYVDDSGDTHSLASEEGVLIQGTAELTGYKSGNASKNTVADTTTSATIISANADRTGFSIVNTSSGRLLLAFGGTASATNCFIALSQWQECSMYGVGVWTGAITGVWLTDPNDGVAVWNELTE